ncbi:MAG: type IX secretion system sortase PorU [Thermonemataceae bacterium]
MIRLFLLWLVLMPALSYAQYADNSVLRQGNWYKLAIPSTGIYRIDAALLNEIGIDPQTVDPRTLKIHGTRGGMLPQENSADVADDLPEIPIWFQGNTNAQWETTEYFLFYAEGADSWQTDVTEQRYIHQKNLYDDNNYYFLTLSGSVGERIVSQPSVPGALQEITTFDERLFYEIDETNLLHQQQSSGSGREWYGDNLSFDTQKTFNFSLTGILPSSDILLTSAVLAQSFSPTQFSIQANGQAVGTQNVPAIIDATYTDKGADAVNTYSLTASTLAELPNLDITYTFNKSGVADRGYLNYIRLVFQKALRVYEQPTFFRSWASTQQAVSTFRIAGGNNNTVVWDITDPLQPRAQAYELAGSDLRFGANTTTLKEFVTFQLQDAATFSTPTFVEAVPNQDLHALATPNLLIIAPEVFLTEAQRLADLRRTHDRLSVAIVPLSQIYNEFSSGRQDVSALRNFAKMLYDRDAAAFQYLLLFGDASFDYKDRLDNNTNFVPIYESRESLHPIYSYSSDDYFGFLEEDEGTWQETTANNAAFDHTLDIGVGRLPVKTAAEAKVVVDKLIHYATNRATLGNWRNRITFVADDGDANQHQRDADDIGENVRNTYTDFNLKKIFLDAYEQETTPSGQRAPEARDLLDRTVEKGTLILNYTGHGGEVGWTEEFLLRSEQVTAWENYDRLPLIITATCEFGRYDEPFVVSGAELALLSPTGGAIALITTTRPVFSSTNFLVNRRIFEIILEEEEGRPRLGDIMRYTKNNSLSGSINRNFALLGDPSMQLAYPEEEIAITHINGKDISVEQDTLKALEKITFAGEVRNSAAQRMEDFNGILEVAVFDKASQRSTIGTENSASMDFNVRETRLFQGKVTVKEGKFSFSFIPPKNINYAFGEGKVSLYAYSDTRYLDAGNGKSDLIVGGSASQLLQDVTPPEVRLFLNDTTFRDGGLVAENPSLLALLYDENGINISDIGIGHSITAFLNDSVDNKAVLNEYYTADLDTYQSGQVVYPFKDLPNGRHTLTFEAWDVYNNPTEKTIAFIVAEEASLAIQEVFNYPNPFETYTDFQIEHNRPGDHLEVTIDIYTLQGQAVTTLRTTVDDSPTRLDKIRWDVAATSNDATQSGVYIYRVTVRSLTDASQRSVTQRLVIIK